jgi:hypothetical protein
MRSPASTRHLISFTPTSSFSTYPGAGVGTSCGHLPNACDPEDILRCKYSPNARSAVDSRSCPAPLRAAATQLGTQRPSRASDFEPAMQLHVYPQADVLKDLQDRAFAPPFWVDQNVRDLEFDSKLLYARRGDDSRTVPPRQAPRGTNSVERGPDGRCRAESPESSFATARSGRTTLTLLRRRRDSSRTLHAYPRRELVRERNHELRGQVLPVAEHDLSP